MKYELYINNKGYKRVKFEDGTDYCVNKDEEGREYFPVPNLIKYNPTNSPFKKLFTGRIKDAIETIRKGDGDVLSVVNLFGKSENVYKFVDREYGEQLREKTIEGFKDVEFGYSLKFGYLNSMSGSRYIAKDNTLLTIFDNPNDYIYFDTEQEVENFKQNTLKQAQRFANNYTTIKINNKNNEDKIMKWVHKNFNHTIFSEVGWAMLNKEENQENKWKLEIVQVIKTI